MKALLDPWDFDEVEDILRKANYAKHRPEHVEPIVLTSERIQGWDDDDPVAPEPIEVTP